jgi:adenosine deaminase
MAPMADPTSILDERPELTELHCHVGGGVDPAIMWSIAHQAGIRLPTKDYWPFVELITVSHPDKVNNLAEYDQIFRWTELIQSSPMAVERSVYEIIGATYRACNITAAASATWIISSPPPSAGRTARCSNIPASALG